jgi:UDP-N-acetylglucosamine 4,6-dehydratase (inverting)
VKKKSEMFKDSTILVTGGTGSFGQQLISRLLRDYSLQKIIVYSRDELKQYEMQHIAPFSDYPKVMRYFIGDVRDRDRLNFALKSVDVVVHAAALKQVPAAEYNPFEAVKTNVIGGQNVIDAAINNNVERIISLSTDKAAAPINVYGATKLTSDKLFIAANNYSGIKVRFSVVRYGNVMGSRGSVIPLFLEKRRSGALPITDLSMTRFSITLDEGVSFVLNCFSRMEGGELFIPKIPSYRLLDLAKAIAPNLKHNITGIRPGEKLYEEMITENDSGQAIDCGDYYICLPSSTLFGWDRDSYIEDITGGKARKCPSNFSYRSDNNERFLTVNELRQLIINEVPGGKVLIDLE